MIESPYPVHPIMVIDDEQITLDSMQRVLKSNGMNNLILSQDSRDVMTILSKNKVSIVLLDLLMPHVPGEQLLISITETFPEICIIIFTGVNDVDTAVRCVQNNAFDYLLKPVDNNRLITTVMRALEFIELADVASSLKNHVISDVLKHGEVFSDIITRNAEMISIFRYLEAVGKSSKPILITGETGVGKELVALAVHRCSERDGEFVAVNVAGLDSNVFSDTLFGHVKGAYTGADSTREGLIEKASGGTLFLDEIGDLVPESQIKLLRLIQQKEYFPLGSDLPKRTDARIVLSTNRDLEERVESGTFRKDLFFRLKTHHVHIPPLRDRLEDLPLLLEYFLEKTAAELGKIKPNYPQQLLALLASHHFPGNVRELEAVIYDAIASHSTKMLNMAVFKKHIKSDRRIFQSPADRKPWEGSYLTTWKRLPTMQQINRMLITEALRRTEDNQTLAAEMVGVARQTVCNYVKEISESSSLEPL